MSRRRGAVVSPKDDWQTPKWLLDALRKELGPIGLDPCAAPGNPAGALEFWLEDGLESAWRTACVVLPPSWVFVNPPFSGRQGMAWAQKAIGEARNGVEVVLHLPVSANSQRFRMLTAECDALALFDKRIAHVDPTTGKPGKGSDQDIAHWYFGPRKWAFASALRFCATRIVRGHGMIASEPKPIEKAKAAE